MNSYFKACYHALKPQIAYFYSHNNLNKKQTKDKQTPLHLACLKYGNIDLIKEMIAKGEKINIQDTYGRTCLHHSN